MTLNIEITQYGAGPVIVCDHCSERISDAAEEDNDWAGVTDSPGQRVAIYFLHKQRSPAFEQQNGLVPDSIRLTIMLPYLVQNVQVDFDQAWAQAETLNEL